MARPKKTTVAKFSLADVDVNSTSIDEMSAIKDGEIFSTVMCKLVAENDKESGT